jgi:hypothetical protein
VSLMITANQHRKFLTLLIRIFARWEAIFSQGGIGAKRVQRQDWSHI